MFSLRASRVGLGPSVCFVVLFDSVPARRDLIKSAGDLRGLFFTGGGVRCGECDIRCFDEVFILG